MTTADTTEQTLTDSTAFWLVTRYDEDLGLADSQSVRAANGLIKKWGSASASVAIAFWALREQGVLTLTLAKTKRFGLLPATHVDVAATNSITAGGLEGSILAALTGKNDHVYEIVRRMIRYDAKNPGGELLRPAVRQAGDEGYHAWNEGDKRGNVVGQVVLGNKNEGWVPDGEQVTSLMPRFDALVREFEMFLAADQDLGKTLLQQALKGIQSRQEEDDDGPDLN